MGSILVGIVMFVIGYKMGRESHLKQLERKELLELKRERDEEMKAWREFQRAERKRKMKEEIAKENA